MCATVWQPARAVWWWWCALKGRAARRCDAAGACWQPLRQPRSTPTHQRLRVHRVLPEGCWEVCVRVMLGEDALCDAAGGAVLLAKSLSAFYVAAASVSRTSH